MAASPLAAALLGGGEGGGMNMAGFIDPNIAQATPDLQLAQQMISQGLSTAPASPWQALARVAQAGTGTYLQRQAMGTLAQAYAHSADNAAATLPDTVTADGKVIPHPLKAALQSPDPVVRMQGLQAYQKALTLLSEPSNVAPGVQRMAGLGTNTGPQSDEGKLQQDVERAAARQGRAPVGAPITSPGVPLGPPRVEAGGIESVIGGGPGGAATAAAAPAGVPTSAPNFNDRFAAARPSGVPSNPLQGAIDIQAQKAGATAQAQEAAKAGVEFGDLLKPQPAPMKGPGGTEALTTTHGTLVPPLTDQGALPKTPAEAKPAVETWRKTVDGWNSGLQPGYQAEQRLGTIANVFKTMQSGYGAEQKAHVAALMKSIGINLPDSVLGDPAKVETAIHENYVETLQQLKASTPRFTQMEFRALSENKEHPDLQPAANLQMLSEDMGQLRQARDLPRDWVEAQRHGWRDPQSFEQAWLRQNPLKGYVDSTRKEIGPLKGMPGNEAGAQAQFPGGAAQTPTAPQISSKAEYDALAKGAPYTAPDGTIRHKQ